MLIMTFGAALLYYGVTQMGEVQDRPGGTVYLRTPVATGINTVGYVGEFVENKPVTETQFRNIVRQAYDYSCGSAALTTVLNHYLGRQFEERQIMEGLLRYGESDKIIQRRGFSLLDMKRLVTVLGHPSGGFRGSFDDLRKLDHPAIVPIHHAGFKHFVVVKGYRDGRVYVADPSLGNISFPEEKFKEVWIEEEKKDQKGVLFIIFPNGFKPHSQLEIQEEDLRSVDDTTLDMMALRETLPDPAMAQFQMRRADEAASLRRVIDVDTKSETYNQILNIPLRTYYKRK